MNRLILAGVAAVLCLAAAWAQDAAAPAADNRSADWKKNLTLAVNDETKVQAAMQAMPEADRAAFAADVLAVLQTKRQVVADAGAWAKNYAASAAALIAGAGGARTAVLAAVAKEGVNSCVTAETREMAGSELVQLGALAKGIEQRLKGEDRTAFAGALLAAVGKQKAVDAATHKLALCATSLSLISGAGDAKKSVVAEVFAVVDVADLGAVAKALSDAFNQRKNNLSNDDYLQVAVQILQGVAARTAGQPDATVRFAYAVAAFLGGANTPATFEQNLMGKIADQLAKVGATKESFAVALAAAKADLAANEALVRTLYPALTQKTAWGVIILPPGKMLAGEEGPPFVHENRPPGGYQNQGIGP